jgi:hypothetical protein
MPDPAQARVSGYRARISRRQLPGNAGSMALSDVIVTLWACVYHPRIGRLAPGSTSGRAAFSTTATPIDSGAGPIWARRVPSRHLTRAKVPDQSPRSETVLAQNHERDGARPDLWGSRQIDGSCPG